MTPVGKRRRGSPATRESAKPRRLRDAHAPKGLSVLYASVLPKLPGCVGETSALDAAEAAADAALTELDADAALSDAAGAAVRAFCDVHDGFAVRADAFDAFSPRVARRAAAADPRGATDRRVEFRQNVAERRLGTRPLHAARRFRMHARSARRAETS